MQNGSFLIGSTGRVGTMLALSWTSKEWPLITQHRTSPSCPAEHTSLFWNPLDDTPLPAELPQNTAIIMFAGVTHGTKKQHTVNEQLAEKCCAAAVERGIKRILLASSSAVYGNAKNTPYTETDALRPLTAYGASKARMEEVGFNWIERGLDVCSLRIGNVLGAGSFFKNALQDHDQHNRVTLDLFPNRQTPVRSYIDPITMGQVLASLLSCPRKLPPVLNVTLPTPISMGALADSIGIPYDTRNVPHSPNQNIILCAKHLSEYFQFAPYTDVGEYLQLKYKELQYALG